MKINEIKSMSLEDFNKLTVPELKAGIKAMSDALRKSGKRIETGMKGIYEPVIYKTLKEKPLSRAANDVNSLRKEFARGRGYINSPTTSMRGIRGIVRRTQETLQTRHGVTVSDENVFNMFKTYDKVKERDQSMVDRRIEYHVKQNIAEELDATGADPEDEDLINTALQVLEDAYQEQAPRSEFYEVSDNNMFDLGGGSAFGK